MGVMRLDEALRHGIKLDLDVPKNSQFLDLCQNLRVRPYGLKQHIAVNQPITAAEFATYSITKSWPYPQLFRGRSQTLLVDWNKVYSVTETASGTWHVTALETWDCANWANHYHVDATVTDANYLVMGDSMTNPTFTGAAAPWTLGGADWTWAGHAVVHTNTGATRVIQTAANQAHTVKTGFHYLVTVVVTAHTAGTVRIEVGGTTTPNIPIGTSFYDVVCGAGTTVEIVPTGYAGTITSVSVQRYPAPWHWADFFGTWVLTNGVSTVFSTGHTSKILCSDAVTVQTCCTYKDQRLIYGGFNPANYTNAAWQAIYHGYLDPDNIPTELYNKIHGSLGIGAGTNWVSWSSVGAPEMLWRWRADLAVNGSFETVPTTGFDSTRPWFFEVAIMNQAGAGPMPWRGDVVRTLSLGDSVVVYGKEGVTGLVPQETTMGLRDIGGIGTGIGVDEAGRCCAGGDDQGHIFIDAEGDLWTIGSDLQATNIGHRDIFGAMASQNIQISFDGENREFYIGDGTDCYHLTAHGLSKCPYMPSTVSFAITDTLASGATTAGPNGILFTVADQTVKIQSHEIDAGTMEAQELYAVRIGTTDTDASGWRVEVDYCLDTNATWATSTAMYFDPRGVARVKVPGCKWKVRLMAADRTAVDLERLEVEFRGVADGRHGLRRLV